MVVILHLTKIKITLVSRNWVNGWHSCIIFCLNELFEQKNIQPWKKNCINGTLCKFITSQGRYPCESFFKLETLFGTIHIEPILGIVVEPHSHEDFVGGFPLTFVCVWHLHGLLYTSGGKNIAIMVTCQYKVGYNALVPLGNTIKPYMRGRSPPDYPHVGSIRKTPKEPIVDSRHKQDCKGSSRY